MRTQCQLRQCQLTQCRPGPGAAGEPACRRHRIHARVPRKSTKFTDCRRPAVTKSATESSDRERRRFGRSLPVIAGSVIAAAGLTFGSLSMAGATTGHQPPSISQQAAQVKAEDAYTPVNGNTELNVNELEDQVGQYYGSATT